MIKKIITIAKWEYLEKVKTKTFIISLIVTPLLIISFSILPSLLFREESPKVEVIGVIDIFTGSTNRWANMNCQMVNGITFWLI